jgi:hypothetical protein
VSETRVIVNNLLSANASIAAMPIGAYAVVQNGPYPSVGRVLLRTDESRFVFLDTGILLDVVHHGNYRVQRITGPATITITPGQQEPCT